MGKRVLVLSASPRKGGNSDLLCDSFIRGAVEAGHRVEKVNLVDRRIGYCTGCSTCFTTHRCVQRDDMAGILESMVAADVIVLATPVYFYTMNAQLKTLIDRTVPRYKEISGKVFHFIVAAADEGVGNMARTIESLRGFTACLDNPVEKGIVYGVGAWQKGDVEGSKAMEDAYRMGLGVGG